MHDHVTNYARYHEGLPLRGPAHNRLTAFDQQRFREFRRTLGLREKWAEEHWWIAAAGELVD